MKEESTWEGLLTPRARNFMTAPADDSRALVDTNIVVYAYDLDDPRKHSSPESCWRRSRINAASS